MRWAAWLLAIGSAHARCPAIGGAENLFAPGRAILVGEIHGTREMPEMFVALACHAAAQGFDVLVGFEGQPTEALQHYLASSGDRGERLRIVEPRLAGGDGTASEAMTDAFEAVRKLAQETQRVHAFGFHGPGDVGYAAAITAAHQASPQAVLLLLMGNYHNLLKRDAEDGPSTAQLLKQNGLELRTIYLELTGGAAFNLGFDGSGVHDQGPQKTSGKRGVLVPSHSGEYDFTLSVGRLHPSPPAHN